MFETLDALFRDDPRTLRYGGGENLYGYEAIKAFRAGRSPAGLARDLSKTVITTYGRDTSRSPRRSFAVLPRPIESDGRCRRGCDLADGWFIVAAHVSVIADPGD